MTFLINSMYIMYHLPNQSYRKRNTNCKRLWNSEARWAGRLVVAKLKCTSYSCGSHQVTRARQLVGFIPILCRIN